MGQATDASPRPKPTTLNLLQEPQVQEEEFDLEGLLTCMDSQKSHRTSLASTSICKHRHADDVFSVKRTWLEASIAHMPRATADDREQMRNALMGEHALDDDDDSPSGRVSEISEAEKLFLIGSYAETHRCFTRLLELNRLEIVVHMLHCAATLFPTCFSSTTSNT